MKICFAASSGGHLEEIARLKEIAQNNESFLLTEKSSYQEPDLCERVIYVNQINRKELLFIPKFLGLMVRSLLILHKERPQMIISTGALATYPICRIGKWKGIKIVYIESFARINEASLTGKLMYPIADLFIVQWEEMKKIFPNAVYGGGIF